MESPFTLRVRVLGQSGGKQDGAKKEKREERGCAYSPSPTTLCPSVVIEVCSVKS
jgi:hypothetical protein